MNYLNITAVEYDDSEDDTDNEEAADAKIAANLLSEIPLPAACFPAAFRR